jgi:aminopeptidase YwaD
MRKTVSCLTLFILTLTLAQTARGQFPSYYQYNLLESRSLGLLIGESSGERAYQHIVEMAGYAMLRSPQEFEGDFMETEYVMSRLREYGFTNATVDRFGKSRTWQGVTASLWETAPRLRKIADLVESPLMLASGSADVSSSGELIYVDAALVASGMEGVDFSGKIIFTGERPGSVLAFAGQKGVKAVISFYSPRPLENPLMLQSSSTGGRGQSAASSVFFVSPREGEELKRRVLSGEKIVVQANAVTTFREAELQVISCAIEGSSADAEEVIVTAHLFEGYVKTGGNDNISGSAAMLEAARTLKKLIDDSLIDRPARTIRFLWIPEFSGTIPWVKANSELMKKTLCNVNLDMVGLSLAKYRSFFVLHRTSYGNGHFVGDVVESFFRYVGETNKVNSVVSGSRFFRPITAPTGTDDPFYYEIEGASGGSDHMVFNDPGVMVPGVLIITWPDPFYHTSEDLADKCDPTQMKRTVFITAASAYSIASASTDEAMAILGEVASNAVRRMGVAQSVASDMISQAGSDELAGIAMRAVANIRGTALGETVALNSVLTLSPGSRELKALVDYYGGHIGTMSLQQTEMLQKLALSRAELTGAVKPDFRPSAGEKAAAKLKPSFLINPVSFGYGAYQAINSRITAEARTKFDMRGIADAQEALKLINGKNSILDIKYILDSQYSRETDIQALTGWMNALREAGILTF